MPKTLLEIMLLLPPLHLLLLQFIYEGVIDIGEKERMSRYGRKIVR